MKELKIFDVDRPGDEPTKLLAINKGKQGQRGIISTIAFPPPRFAPGPSIFAAGSYDGTTQIYDARCEYAPACFRGHLRGVTKVAFSPCGNYVLSGARKNDEIWCWDFRKAADVILDGNTSGGMRVFKRDKSLAAIYQRTCRNNQKVAFCVHKCGRYLFSGSQK